ncbi:MAG: hypothetical protein JSU72_03265 [Deltaproteobacteria bacterium]|nr:MAG: hypothetical protein JSU72_03265 [Deltaproteobacteria bacterium]
MSGRTVSTPYETRGKNLDALVYSAEAGSAWSQLYPDYTVAIPLPDLLAVPLGYAMARGDRETADFVSGWIDLKKERRNHPDSL